MVKKCMLWSRMLTLFICCLILIQGIFSRIEVMAAIGNKENNGAQNFVYGNGHSAKCYYRDNYFENESDKFNYSLATMSLCFAMSAFANEKEPDYNKKSSNGKAMLKSVIGVKEDQIAVNEDYLVKPTTDSIGVIIGNKKIRANGKDYTLIAMAIRGGGYEKEWAGNFTTGLVGDHDGFSSAKLKSLLFLRRYIEEKRITGPIKIWITGYSRAGATANLLGGEINKQIEAGNLKAIGDNVECKRTDVYTYCFEVPQGVYKKLKRSRKNYNNIFNIINPYDPVPRVAPSEFGFNRYGQDKFLISRILNPLYYKIKLKNMLSIYERISENTRYTLENFRMKKLDVVLGNGAMGATPIIKDDVISNMEQDLYLSNYFKIISKKILKNRENYFYKYQENIREICKLCFGNQEGWGDKFIRAFFSQAVKEMILFVGACASENLTNYDFASHLVQRWVKNAMVEAGVAGYDEKTTLAATKKLAKLLAELAIKNPNYFITFVLNHENLLLAHYPEVCYAWLASADRNYVENPQDIFSTGLYRTIRINCPVDVEVTNEKGEIVASIVKENPIDFGDGGLIAGINENEEKYVIVPIDGLYNVKITAREDSTVNYGIDEDYVLGGNSARLLNYFDLEIKKGQSYTGIIPAYNNVDIENAQDDGSTVAYTLMDPDKNLIQASSDLRGEQAESASYLVDVDSSNHDAGIVFGGGVFNFGSFAKLDVIEKEGYAFNGWYDENGVIVSNDKEYRFCVKANTKLIARFDKEDTNTSSSYISSYDSIKNAEDAQPRDINEFSISLKKVKYIYSGKAIRPEVLIKAENTKLEAGKHYKVEYLNNENVGTATVKISGLGECTGTAIKKFRILPKGTKFTKTSNIKRALKLNWKKQTEQTDGYQIQYSTNSKFTNNFTKIKTINMNNISSYRITKLKKDKLYIRIRTYKILNGIKYCSSWSKVNVVKVKRIE